MNDIIIAIIFGLIQAVTEFLPISSSAHLVIFRFISDITLSDPLAFDVSLHVGSVFALILYFYKDILYYIKGFLECIVKKKFYTLSSRMWLYLILGTLPAVIIGGLFSSYIIYFQSILSISIFLILGGCLFLYTEKYIKTFKNLETLSLSDAFLIGCFQVLALMPGVSRSGITIITGMWFKLTREQAAKFSFLLGIPVLLAAGTKKGIDLLMNPDDFNVLLFVFGIMSSFLFSYLVISFFLSFVRRYSLNIFGYYRILLGIILLIFWFYQG